ncbi:hypothetical protein [Hyphococcus sp. DH-69]|uniref:hypothetical protein n=1 Tax=Hyphococcus formosus TaxID=3143534 RepID=UPI00398B70D1
MVWCARIPELSAHGKAALARLADICDHSGHPMQTLSQATLATDCGFSVATLKRCLHELEDVGLIRRTRAGPERNYRCNYTVNLEVLLSFLSGEKKLAFHKNEKAGLSTPTIAQAEPNHGSPRPVDRSNHGRTVTNNTDYTNTKRTNDFARSSSDFVDHSEADHNVRITKAMVSWLIKGSSCEEGFVEPGGANFSVSPGAMTAAQYALSALRGNSISSNGNAGQRIQEIMDALHHDRENVQARCLALLNACDIPIPTT